MIHDVFVNVFFAAYLALSVLAVIGGFQHDRRDYKAAVAKRHGN